MTTPPAPLSYGVLLFPGFEVLDIAGPLECLNTLCSFLPAHTPQPTLSILSRAASATTPDVPLAVTPAYPSSPGPFAFRSAQVYLPTHTLTTAPHIDVLLIPGGLGCGDPAGKMPEEVAYVRKVFPKLKYLFTVCNGSGVAAVAGVLDGHRATSNKAWWQRVAAFGPKTYWVAKARWVESGNVWTCSGVSAGTDGMLAFLERVYKEVDEGLVQRVADSMEYRRETDATDDPFCVLHGAQDVPPIE